MFRNLAPQALGLASCPLNELVELALTHRFGGLEIDLEDFQRQVESRGMASAKRYLASAALKISSLQLPMEWDLHEADYPQQIERLKKFVPIVNELGCQLLVTHVHPGSNFRVYHENFEFHRRRLSEIADLLGEHDIRLGLTFSAIPSEQAAFSQPFLSTFEGLTTLVRTMTTNNVSVVVDVWHWAVSQGTLAMIEQLGVGRIADVRLADFPETMVSLETIRAEDRVLPGENPRIGFATILQTLKGMDYRGAITPYPHPSYFANQRRDVIVRNVAQSLEMLLGPNTPGTTRSKVSSTT
jgi:sugar phosphate isomerase/epimerase